MPERTLAIIKPHAVTQGDAGLIIYLIEKNKFAIVAMKKLQLTQKQAQEFYAVHKERPFYGELVETMTEGPVIVLVLEKDNAIREWRDLMGTTNPANAAPGTLRKMFATSIGNNAVHGSDAPETAGYEVPFFFPEI
jgi:nucleoside-diphosphate kinase